MATMKIAKIFEIPAESIARLKAWREDKKNTNEAPWGADELVNHVQLLIPLASDYSGPSWATHTYYIFYRGAWRNIPAGKLEMHITHEIRHAFRQAGFRQRPKPGYCNQVAQMILMGDAQMIDITRPEPKDTDVSVTVFGENEVMHVLKNGNLKTGLPDPRHLNTAAITGRLDSKDEPREFLKWLDWFCQGDAETVKVIQELFGYALTPHFLQPYVVFLYGAGRNGKTTLIRVLREVVGKRNAVAVQMQDISNQTVELFAESLINVVSESDMTKKPQYDLIKQLCDGDPITCNPKYRVPRTIYPVARQWFCVNSLPLAADVTYAWRERMVIIPTPPPIDPDQRDPHLLDKFRGEADAIRAWALAGLRRLAQKNGLLSKCQRIADECARYWASATNTGLFWQAVREQLLAGNLLTFGSMQVTPLQHFRENAVSVSVSQAYALYKSFCEENGYLCKSSKTFGDETHAGELNVQKRKKSNATTYMIDVKWRVQRQYAASAPATLPADPLVQQMQQLFAGDVEPVEEG